ncbi:MAG: hypothetical protein JG781_2493 [Peptococcaceae bacterium]|nr:hypothetical protein [Peptococcaceae bacterium]
MNYDFYITPQEYERAAQNGISPAVLEVRVRSLAWAKDRAISEPPQKKKRLPSHLVKLAEQNGICYRTFLWRVNTLGWDPERAATQQLQDRKAQAIKAYEKSRVYPREYVEMAKNNGIPYDTFRRRVKSGWDIEKAATLPPLTSREIGLMTKGKREKWIKGIFKK